MAGQKRASAGARYQARIRTTVGAYVPAIPIFSIRQFKEADARLKAGQDDNNNNEEKCEATIAVEALDPGVPYESRWAPYVRVHGPGQGQFPKGSIRPRGYMAPDARRSFAPPM
jgi:hypothetical protein